MGTSLADGYVVTGSQYDNMIYTIGSGPSATTVSAPGSGISMGSSFEISGTVTDQSPGALAVSTKMGYGPNDVPAVSDASQEAWMEYLYEQQAMPTNATGVPVTISLIDPNGNYVNLGTTTSNLNGVYGLAANTNKFGAGPGQYEVIASFDGSNSYGSSSASSYFVVNAAPAAAAAPTATPTSAADLYFVPAIAGIIVVIIIGFVVLALLMLRKRP